MNARDEHQQRIADILALGPVLPVVTIDAADHAVPLARALLAGGIRAIEVTLRTGAALDAVRAIADAVPAVAVGVGTVLDAAQLEAARVAGARFAVSPGAAPRLLDAADASDLPLLPGAATASEAMALLERGYRFQKFFPAIPAGGARLLAAWAAPLAALRFCPTGGIGPANAGEFLALPNVACIGGSWLAPPHLLAAGDFAGIEALARAAAGLEHGATP